jgi:hypothetical protein
VYYAPAPLPRERPETPSALERVINRALEKDCASRYQTAAEMRDELQQLVHESYLRLIDQMRPGVGGLREFPLERLRSDVKVRPRKDASANRIAPRLSGL